jgi:hypothetical protein
LLRHVALSFAEKLVGVATESIVQPGDGPAAEAVATSDVRNKTEAERTRQAVTIPLLAFAWARLQSIM